MIVKDNALFLDFNLAETKAYQTMPQYNYWKGWWTENPRNPVEEVIKLLWQDLIDPNDYLEGGFEYWSRVFDNSGFLEWHQDTCEIHYTGEKYEIADKSLVYYVEVSYDLAGGVLEMAPYSERRGLEEVSKSAMCVDTSMVERIKPKENRFVLMESSQMHRVTPIYKGKRKNLASSIWKQTPKMFKEHENWSLDYTCNKIQKEIWKEKEIK